MKLFSIVILFSPLIISAQSPGRRDDSLRKTADTIHYPAPFVFTKTYQTSLNKNQAFDKAGRWLEDIKDSLKAMEIVKDYSRYRLTATNVPATADISFAIIIKIQPNQYSCWLQNYVFHSINGKAIPLHKAASIKEFKETANIEKVLIMQAYPHIFKSLSAALK